MPYLAEMNDAFATDFSGVRAYTDANSRTACRLLGADAYAFADAVAFAAASPPRTVVAHELAHVLQQRRGPQGPTSSSPDALESHAGEAARQLAQTGRIRAPASPSRVAMLRALGTFSFQGVASDGTPGWDSGPIDLRARTVDEWKAFLANDADSASGSIELNAFLSLSLGRQQALAATNQEIHFPPPVEHWNITSKPTQQESIDLMKAMLMTGSDIDFADTRFEGEEHAKAAVGQLLADFTGRFTQPALQQLSTREFTGKDIGSVSAFVTEAASTRAQGSVDSWGQPTVPNPSHVLIAAAIGTAFGAATQVLQVGDDPAQQDFKRNAFLLLRNAAMTIRGALDSIEAAQASEATLLTTVFAAAVGAGAAATGGASLFVQTTAWGLGGAAAAYFPSLISGDGRKRIRDLRDEFHDKVNKIKTVMRNGVEQPVSASDLEIVKNDFDLIIIT